MTLKGIWFLFCSMEIRQFEVFKGMNFMIFSLTMLEMTRAGFHEYNKEHRTLERLTLKGTFLVVHEREVVGDLG